MTTRPFIGLRSLIASTAILAASIAASAGEPPALTSARAMDAVMWGEEPIGGSFSLTDHAGTPRTEADYRGKVVLVYFGFTFCPDICPADLMAIGGALNELGDKADQVQGLFITLDPERDNKHLGDYAQAFHPSLVGLTGEVSDIRRTANDYKVYFQKIDGVSDDDYTIDHTAFTYLYGQDGVYRGFFPPGTTSSQIADGLRPLLDD